MKRIGYRTGVLYDGLIVGQVRRRFLGITFWTDEIVFDNKKDAIAWLNDDED